MLFILLYKYMMADKFGTKSINKELDRLTSNNIRYEINPNI